MALGRNNQIDWADIENIYTKLNTERTRFGFTQKTIPSNQNVTSNPNDVISLKDSIEEMKSHYRLSSVASTDSVETPSSGDLMVTNPFDTINSIVTNITNTPTYGANYGYNSSNYGHKATNDGYNSSNNVWNSGNFSYNNTNNGYNNGNNAYKNSNNTWNSGNFGYNSSKK